MLLLVSITSLGAFLLGTRCLGLRASGLRRTRGPDGLTVLFLAANLAVGGAAVLGLRVVTGGFVSVYALNDVTLVGLSALQALAFAWWRGPRD